MTLNWPIIILCAVGISILLTIIVLPQILHVSFAKRLFDRPSNRKIHNGVVPRVGGFAFLPVIILTMGVMLVMPSTYILGEDPLQNPQFLRYVPELLVLLAAMTILFLTGLYDDLMGLKYGVKFLSQFLAAILLMEAGDYILNYSDLFGITVVGTALGKIMSGFLFIYIVNSLNLIDGIDGLAAGISVITLSFFGYVLYIEQIYLYSLLAWIGVGTMAVFWIFNVFGNKKRRTKIFMGDIGSLSMGGFLAFIALFIGKQPAGSAPWGVAPLVLALSPLVLPMLDVVRVFCLRILKGSSPFLPDKKHIHHLMLNTGMPMRVVMTVLLLLQIGVLVLNLWLYPLVGINLILIINVIIYLLCVLLVNVSQKLFINNNKE